MPNRNEPTEGAGLIIILYRGFSLCPVVISLRHYTSEKTASIEHFYKAVLISRVLQLTL